MALVNATGASRTINAAQDLRSGLLGTGIWFHLAWQETRLKYKRSVIGPFWITISTGVMVAALGPLYGTLLKQDIATYFQHLAVSMILWAFISGTLNESCTAFIGAAGYIKEIKLPLSAHVLRVLTKNGILLGHNSLIILLVLVVFPPSRIALTAAAVPGLILLVANLMWIGMVLAILCARFRDIPLIVMNVLQVLFFVTPIVWKREMLAEDSLVTALNPLFHMIHVVQAPLLGQIPSATSWAASVGFLIAGGGFAFWLFAKYRGRIAYWV